MLEIVVASGKGGVGKSTVASTLAIHLSRRWPLIAVDADADAPNLHLILGVEKWEREEAYGEALVAEIREDKCIKCGRCREECPYGAIDLVEGRYMVSSVLCEGCLTCTLVCPVKGAIKRIPRVAGYIRETVTRYGFPLISARMEPGRPNTGKIVSEEKERARSRAGKDTVIVIDAAAGIGCQVVSSLAGSHLAVLVAEPTPASFSDLKRVYTLTRHFMQPAVLVINKHDINPGYTEKLEEFAEKEGIEVIGRIPYDDKLPLSMAAMKPIIEAYPESPASEALRATAERVAEITADWRRWFLQHRPKTPQPYKPEIIKPPGF